MLTTRKKDVPNIKCMHWRRLAKPTRQKTLEFHRKELPVLGWTMRAGTDKIDKGATTVMWDAPEKEPLRLELVALKEGHTAVLIARAPKGK